MISYITDSRGEHDSRTRDLFAVTTNHRNGGLPQKYAYDISVKTTLTILAYRYFDKCLKHQAMFHNNINAQHTNNII